MLDGPYPSRTKSGAKRKYPWDELKVGDFFVLENRKMSSMGSAMHYANQSRWPKRFVSRTIGNNLEVRRVK